MSDSLIADQSTDKLAKLIQESFRVRPNHDPVYVDIGGHLQTIALPQHQVIFGRRGSGKSCLMVHYHRIATKEFDTFTVYVEGDEVKRLRYPDLLIRLLLSIFEKMPGATRGRIARFFRRSPSLAEQRIANLRELLDRPDTSQVQVQEQDTTQSSASASAEITGAALQADSAVERVRGRKSEFVDSKLDELERNLQDYKAALREALGSSDYKQVALLVDDFYLIPRSVQPDVIDYLHRLVRGTEMYLKVGTVRHRTVLHRSAEQTIGVELFQDVQEINLDQTFEDLDATEAYLVQMLGEMAAKVGIEDVGGFFNPDARRQLALASGGVPRDFLTIFSEALNDARSRNSRWLTPTSIYKGGSRIAYRTKLPNLRLDSADESGILEAVFRDLLQFCLVDKKKTAFLISQDEIRGSAEAHDVILQLMDFKLIHIIEPDTSAASGRSGRFEAYTLDFSLFMEPRMRGIEHVEFWKIDAGRRRQGVREAPTYPLARILELQQSPDESLSTEELLAELTAEGFVE